jgi:hypothetical protein
MRLTSLPSLVPTASNTARGHSNGTLPTSKAGLPLTSVIVGSSLFAAYALARQLRSDERFVAVQIPTEVGADWNNVHQLRRRDLTGTNHG